jgi:phosphopantetheinyl transferase
MEQRLAVGGGAVPQGVVPVGPIELWLVDLDRAPASPDDPGLTPDDRAQAGRIRDPVVSGRLLSRRLATRAIVARTMGEAPASSLALSRTCPRCGGTDHGRPFLAGSSTEISVSASGRLAVVAVSPRPVGVDIELWHPDIRPLPAALTAAERRAVFVLPSGEQGPGFLRLWAAKEALLKAGGRSLADDPASVDMAAVLTGDRVPVDDGGRTWQVRLLRLGHHHGLDPVDADKSALVVVDADGGDVVRREWPERPGG